MRDEVLRVLRHGLADRYVIEEALGGGMSTVFRAIDLQHDRTVAIKALRTDYGDKAADRFRHEIETVAHLSHPRIVPLFDSGQVADLAYYVMPFIEGASLRQRLEREAELPIDEALRITREVGEALQYAHSHGVVHRDVKPANVLITEGGAVLTDFGIAKQLEPDSADPITRTGTFTGTPGYMSPEQATGQMVDARSDQYGLAVLLYEMLAGQPPFYGDTPNSRLAKQLALPAPSVAQLRETVPRSVDIAIHKAMSKSAADRFASVDEFLSALETQKLRPRFGAHRRVVRRATWIVPALLMLGLGTWLAVTRPGPIASDADVPPDTSVYVLIPFQSPQSAGEELHEIERLEDAFTYWEGLRVVGQLQLAGSLASLEADPSIESAARLARRHGAGRFIWGRIQQLGDSRRVSAGLYDALSNGKILASDAIRIPPSLENADSLFEGMASQLLFRGDPPPADRAAGSRSLPAVKDVRRGLRAMQEWDLPRADAAFESARNHDPEYAEAQLWLALVRRWRGRPETDWSLEASQAYLHRADFSDDNRSMAAAIRATASRDFERACATWDQLSDAQPDSVVHWYGLAHCLTSDSTVVPDPRSPSGWAFSTSWNQALEAYEEAFRLRPAILGSFERTAYQPLQRLFMVGGNQRRAGLAEGVEFSADPIWVADTLGFVPYPISLGAQQPLGDKAAVSEAVSQLRRRMVRVTRTWAAQVPGDGRAKHALGLALALTGDPAALDTLRASRKLITEAWEKHRVGASEVWFLVAISFPRDTLGLRRARVLADSLLQDSTAIVPLDPQIAVGLASLTGRASLAAAHARAAARLAARSPDEQFRSSFAAPGPLRESAPALMVFSALGGPPDSLTVLEDQVTQAIQSALPPAERATARYQWLNWPASQAFPTRFHGESDLPTGDQLLDAERAWFSGDTAAVRSYLLEARRAKRDILPPHRTLDTLYPESYLWWLLGQPQAAVECLDPTFAALPQVHPAVLALPPNSGALVRGAILRARLALELDRPEEARMWTSAARALWAEADEYQQQIISQVWDPIE